MSRFWLLFLILPALFLGGCWRAPAEPPQPGPLNDADAAVMGDSAQIETLEQARKVYIELKTRAKAAEARVKVMEEQAQAARLEALKATCWWVAGIAFFAAIICVAAAFFLETARKLLLTGAGAGFGIMVLSIIVSYMLPYAATAAPFVAIGLGVSGIGLAVWYFMRIAQVKNEHVQVGVEALYRLSAFSDKEAEAIKEQARKRQEQKRLHDEVAAAVRKVKKINGYHDPDPGPPDAPQEGPP